MILLVAVCSARSTAKVRVWAPVRAAMPAATSSRTAWRRATSTTFTPRSASPSAKAAPTPSDAPATSAHGPYLAANIAAVGSSPKRLIAAVGSSPKRLIAALGSSPKRLIAAVGSSPKRLIAAVGSSPKRLIAAVGSSPKRLIAMSPMRHALCVAETGEPHRSEAAPRDAPSVIGADDLVVVVADSIHPGLAVRDDDHVHIGAGRRPVAIERDHVVAHPVQRL